MCIPIRQGLSVVFACVALAGCSVIDGTARLKNPAIIDQVHSKDAPVSVALTSDRRLIVFYPDGTSCPEAPPDTSSNISGSVSAAFKAAATAKSTANADAAAALIDQAAVALSRSAPQSQGSLIMRSAFAFACTSAKNGMMNEQEYNAFLSTALSAAVALSYVELSLNGGKIGGNGVVGSTAPALGGEQASLDFAAAKAEQAAKEATKEAGTKASDDAGKVASDAVKAKAGTTDASTVSSLAASAGEAARDAVFAKTRSNAKATIAELTAKANVASGLASIQAVEAPKGKPDLAGAVAVAAPFAELARSYSQKNGSGSAAAQEKEAFQAMLAQEADRALAALDSAYAAYPQYHNISEIRSLIQNDYVALKEKDQKAWKKLYSTIVMHYAWGAPPDELAQMRQAAQ